MTLRRDIDPSQPCLRPGTYQKDEMDNIELVNDNSKTTPLTPECKNCSMAPGEQHGWKPATMRAPVLVSFALLSVCLIICIEILSQISEKNGALFLIDDANDLPRHVTFAYLYLPTIIAVIYRLMFSWIDLDVKRLYPWLQLSKPGSVKGNDSLFLHYEYDFWGWVHIKSLPKAHWTIATSNLIMFMIALGITPLYSSIFGTIGVYFLRTVRMSAPLQFMDPVAQAAVLDPAVLNSAYAITWLDQPFPAFTTGNYTLMPFYPLDSVQGHMANWTGVTTKYWTELQCWPAIGNHSNPLRLSDMRFDNGKGCHTHAIDTTWSRDGESIFYIGWWDDIEIDISLRTLGCGPAAINQFLAIWTDQFSDTNMTYTAEFCETSYHKQKVRAVIRADGLVPVDNHIEPLGPIEPLLPTEFNISAFENLVGTGMSMVDVPREYPFTILPDFSPKLKPVDHDALIWTPTVALALGITNSTQADFSDPAFMKEAFQAAHRLQFSAAFQTLLVNGTSSSNETGTVYTAMYGVGASRLFSLYVEIFLGMVALLVMILFWQCHRSPSMLSRDPGTLGFLFGVVQNSPLLLKAFQRAGSFSTKEMKASLGDCDFQLICGCQDPSGERTLRLVGGCCETGSDLATNGNHTPTKAEKPGHYAPVKPYQFRLPVGLIFTILLSFGVVSLCAFWFEAQSVGGIPLPFKSYNANEFLMSSLPTFFASILIEPFWGSSNRMLCLLQPFFDLLSDRGTPQRTINARYTSIPAQFTLWRAVKSKHFLLGLLCVSAWLGNILSVGLGGFFHRRPVPMTYSLDMSRQADYTVSDLRNFSMYFGSADDIIWTPITNLTYGTALPSWMTAEYSFLPVDLSSDVFEKDALYSTRTIGFGTEPSCTPLGTVLTENKPPTLDPFVSDVDDDIAKCFRHYSPVRMEFENMSSAAPKGKYANEASTQFLVPAGVRPGCEGLLILAWSRANFSTAIVPSGVQKLAQVNTSFAICKPVAMVAEFQVDFDYQGRIINATALTNATSTYQHADLTDALQTFMKYSILSLSELDVWHKDDVSHDYFNYLLRLEMDTGDVYNPAAPIPDLKRLLPYATKVLKFVYASSFNNRQKVFLNTNKTPVVGTRTVIETRAFVSLPAFIASAAILVFYLMMVVLLYAFRGGFFFPRLPDSVGSQLAYIAASSFANRGSAPKKILQELEDKTFKFGTLTGPDGREHIGIDSSDRITPLDPKSFKGRADPEKKSKFRQILRFRKKKKQEEKDSLI